METQTIDSCIDKQNNNMQEIMPVFYEKINNELKKLKETPVILTKKNGEQIEAKWGDFQINYKFNPGSEGPVYLREFEYNGAKMDINAKHKETIKKSFGGLIKKKNLEHKNNDAGSPGTY